MTSIQLDSLITDLLESVFTISRFKTCLCIRLSDYAAQCFGYRSTRCMDDKNIESVDEKYQELLDSLYNTSGEMLAEIKKDHTYKEYMYGLSEYEVEQLLEDDLFDNVVSDKNEINCLFQ